MSTRRRRTRGPEGSMLARVAALMAGVLLVSGAAVLTWWGERVPAAPEPPVRALQVPAPAADTVYACPAAPTNTLGLLESILLRKKQESVWMWTLRQNLDIEIL